MVCWLCSAGQGAAAESRPSHRLIMGTLYSMSLLHSIAGRCQCSWILPRCCLFASLLIAAG